MKAQIIQRYGKNVSLQMTELPTPEMRDDDVMVQVHAAGVNPLDAKIKSGDFRLILRYQLPLILGNDVAGKVVAVGSRVKRFQVGDEVYARPAKDRIGTFAEFIALNENDVALKPKSLSMQEAASLPLVGLTAWQALIERGNLQPGQKVFIQAGSGGVGNIAIPLAKHLGATVATTASSANFDLIKGLGADIVIDYRKDDFETVLRDYDLVLHSQDANALEKSLRVLRLGGKLVSISGPPDPQFGKEFGVGWFLTSAMRLLSWGVRRRAKQRNIDYSFLFMHPSGSQLSELATLVDSGAIHPIIDRVFPFSDSNEALSYVETGRAKGKVVINIM